MGIPEVDGDWEVGRFRCFRLQEGFHETIADARKRPTQSPRTATSAEECLGCDSSLLDRDLHNGTDSTEQFVLCEFSIVMQ